MNMGKADRIIRIVVAAVFAWLYFGGIVTGTVGVILLVLGGVFIVTGLFGSCPIYSITGLSTCPAKKE